MEIFAFTQNSVGYEDLGAEPQLRSFNELNLEIPKSAIAGAVGTAAAVAVMGAAPDAHALVRPGAQCAAVGTIQQAVGVSADNVYGPITTSAVRSFQSRNSLLVDGIVGPSTATALGLSAGISCLTTTPPVGGGGTFTVTASVLNVRATPSLASAVITSLPRGTTVTIAETSGDWARLSGQTGWVSRAYLSTGSTTPTPPVGGGGVYTVTASALNVRATPSTSGAVITALPSGATVNIAETSGGWARLSGQTGWVSLAYLSPGSGTTPTPPVGGGGLYTVQASAVNVRATPSTSGSVITTLSSGTSVNISSVNSQGWAKLANQAGWVAFYLLD